MRRYRAVSLGMPITRPAAPLRRSDPITTRPAAASKRSEAMRKGRQADSARRHQRVITTLERASNDGAEISVSAIHALQAAPAASGQASGPGITRASLQAGLAAEHERTLRLTSRIRPKHRLSEALG